jgi:radical SAM superfamily enzyme YgiQ (UPF0313 family)
MRIMLVSTNREMLPDPVAPIGAAYVAAAVRQAGHEVRFLDLQFQADAAFAIKDNCRTFRPQVVGLSIRNVDNVAFPHCLSYLPEVAGVIRTLKAAGVKLIVAGGSGFTLMPAELLKALDINLGIVGEGEEAFPELLRMITEKRPVQGLPGLAYRHKGECRVNPPKKLKDLDLSPEPDRDLIDSLSYMMEGGAGNLQTKRGCAFSCAYCTYPIVEGRKVRMRSPAKAADEFVRAAKEHGLKHIFIVDNVFNYPLSHAKEFCRALISRKSQAGWSCYLNPAFVDAELVELLKEAGCKGVEFGSDSASDVVLAELDKGFKKADLVKASALFSQADLPFCHSLLLGSPGETVETVKATLQTMDALKPNAVIAMLGVRVFPGTKLARRAVREGVIKEGDIGLRPVFYFSPGLDMEAVTGVLSEYGRTHTNFIMPGVHLRMTDKIRQRLRGYGFLGPLWEYLKG